MTTPASRVPKEARPFQGRRAGLATRMLASVIDGLLLLAIFAGGYAIWAGLILLWDPPSFEFPAAPRWLVVTVGYLGTVIYLALCWRISGRTYGNEVIGLRVVGRGGRPLGTTASLSRALVCAVFPLGLLWTAVSRDNRSVADLLLRTSVVYDWHTAAPPVRELSDEVRP